MRLSRLYTNQPTIFLPVQFRPGLNVVLAEIRERATLEKDTHNLGKSTLAEVIDFCLLRKASKQFFLIEHRALFDTFVFFLELALDDGSFLTIRRAVDKASKLSFSRSPSSQPDLSHLAAEAWAHWEVPFERAKTLLDGMLDFRVITPWSFRKPLGYALRLQNDYRDVFQLDDMRGAQADWKPFLAHFIGLDAELVQESYALEQTAGERAKQIDSLEQGLGDLARSPDKLDGIILLRAEELGLLEEQLAKFDFALPDQEIDRSLVDDIEARIGSLNGRRYHLHLAQARINESLGATIKFDLGAIESVFADAKVYLGEQLKHDYADLQRFLVSISAERDGYLREELAHIANELATIDNELGELNQRRMKALESLRAAETFEKYRSYARHLVDKKTALALLEQQRGQLQQLAKLRQEHTATLQRLAVTRDKIDHSIAERAATPGRYRTIRLLFAAFIKAVLDRDALLSTKLNDKGHLEVAAEILDDEGVRTSADDGFTYRKLLCIAFDVATFRSYLDVPFLHVCFHDGLFESLDDRKKLQTLKQVREAARQGLQQIVTLIDSDLPVDDLGQRFAFTADEIVVRLHDQGPDGRLFRMETW